MHRLRQHIIFQLLIMTKLQGNQRSQAEIFEKLQRMLLTSIECAVPRGSRVALVDYSRSTNVGDNAIWLGQRKVLHELGTKIVYVSEPGYYNRNKMRRALGDGIVVMQGGGNFGDIWPKGQLFRERVIGDFPENAIVQMPQSIHFNEATTATHVRSVLARHPKFTLFVRDARSLAIARDRLGIDATLAPDTAFALWPLPRMGHAVAPYVVQCRSDRERSPYEPLSSSFDWLTPPDQVEKWMAKQVGHPYGLRRTGQLGVSVCGMWLDQLAHLRLRRGLRLLSRGEVLITDRLHGALIGLLASIPVVAFDDRNGKVRALLETWLRDHPSLRLSSTLEEAIKAAQRKFG